jgi:lipoyl(octanoyl) transferase
MSMLVRRVGRGPYESVWDEMIRFTDARREDAPDELWFVEHDPVYTFGRAGRPEHLLAPQDIPVVRSDRGGQITYHGPGQVVAYVLFDLNRRGIGPRELVWRLEEAIIRLLADCHLEGERRAKAPGVYVGGAKIAALGLRIRRGCSYHGLALNCDLDLGPFAGIDPCGYPGLEVTSLARLGVMFDWEAASRRLEPQLLDLLAAEDEAGASRSRRVAGGPSR